jgi:hypothetical protein
MLVRAAALVVPLAALAGLASPAQPPAGGLRFVVELDPQQVADPPQEGRVLVGIAPAGQAPDFTNYRPPVLPILGADAAPFAAGTAITLGATSDQFPADSLAKLPPGEYSVQAIFAANRDINLPHAPGNRYCDPIRVKLDPAAGGTVALTLDQAYPDRKPADTATVRFLHLPSKLLSDFHRRPMAYRVGVVLPKDFEKEPDKKYGLVLDIGGFGTRYTAARRLPPDPRFVQVVPDGAGPFGDPYQVDSENNGPYGAALTAEVVPYIERAFRCGGPGRRFTCGASTGGWVSLALQLFYPDYFNGCWSQCPDSVTFERFELIDLYADANAFVNRWGFERPSTRTLDGDVISTVRHEVQLEKVLGRRGRWSLSGRDWASWNAVYSPRGKNGEPQPVWFDDGRIDKRVAEAWKKYDLKLFVEKNWPTLGPKLAGGKVNVWVGDADDYYLNAAVHRLKASVARLKDPPFDGRILIEMRAGHTNGGWTRQEMLDAMAARMGRE